MLSKSLPVAICLIPRKTLAKSDNSGKHPIYPRERTQPEAAAASAQHGGFFFSVMQDILLFVFRSMINIKASALGAFVAFLLLLAVKPGAAVISQHSCALTQYAFALHVMRPLKTASGSSRNRQV